MNKELEEIYKKCLKGKSTNYSGRRNVQFLYILFVKIMRQLVEINKKFNHSKQSDYFKNIQKDTGKYLTEQLLLKYSQEQVKTYLEIDNYIKKLIENINKAFDEGVYVKWK